MVNKPHSPEDIVFTQQLGTEGSLILASLKHGEQEPCQQGPEGKGKECINRNYQKEDVHTAFC